MAITLRLSEQDQNNIEELKILFSEKSATKAINKAAVSLPRYMELWENASYELEILSKKYQRLLMLIQSNEESKKEVLAILEKEKS